MVYAAVRADGDSSIRTSAFGGQKCCPQNRTRDFCLSLPLPNHCRFSTDIFNNFPCLLNSLVKQSRRTVPITRSISVGTSITKTTLIVGTLTATSTARKVHFEFDTCIFTNSTGGFCRDDTFKRRFFYVIFTSVEYFST